MDPEQKPIQTTQEDPPMVDKKEERIPIKSLRTYQGDVEEAMAKNKYSATTILVAEQRRKQEAPRAPIFKPQNLEVRNKFFTILGISLFVLGGITIYAVYYFRANEQIEVVKQTKAIIGFTDEKIINIASTSRESFVSRIVSEKQSFKLPVNSVLFLNSIINANGDMNSEKLLSLIGPNMPPSLSRSFENKYMIGVFSFDTSELFIILTTKDFALSYAGMLKWEKDIPFDLRNIFEISESDVSGVFVDEALRNRDLRVLKDQNGKTLLVYSFIDKNTLVITKNENIFNAILAKYLTSQNVR